MTLIAAFGFALRASCFSDAYVLPFVTAEELLVISEPTKSLLPTAPEGLQSLTGKAQPEAGAYLMRPHNQYSVQKTKMRIPDGGSAQDALFAPMLIQTSFLKEQPRREASPKDNDFFGKWESFESMSVSSHFRAHDMRRIAKREY
ncbi:hypothetical protein [Hyphococcus sp.]|jgi:hypothetical protein|uniref:hypothetical protein n=1 Tax=Hyphococcus sp. TaxID=2038636 RepID=UPI003D09E111